MALTQDWFKNNIGNWENWLAKFKGKPNLYFLEIGCFEGRATMWLLENILTDEKSMIEVIDNFKGDADIAGELVTNMEKNFRDNIEPYEPRVGINVGNSKTILREDFSQPQFDFIYVDGSHRAKNVLEDAVLAWDLLKSGGIMIFDDYQWEGHTDLSLNPKMAIDAFLNIYKGEYVVIDMGYQVCIEKI